MVSANANFEVKKIFLYFTIWDDIQKEAKKYTIPQVENILEIDKVVRSTILILQSYSLHLTN